MENDIAYIGTINYRNSDQKFGIKDDDRLNHMYVVGKTGVGKTTLLHNLAIADIQNGNGLALIDAHGDIANEILNYIPEERIKDVIYFNPKDLEYPIAFNPLKGVHPNYHHLVASGLVATFKKIWAQNWGPRMEHILRFTLLTLLQYPDATLLDIQPLLTSEDFRGHVLSHVKDTHIYSFWKSEFEKYNPAFRSEVIAPILNKVGILTAITPLRNIIGQKVRRFRMQDVMDNKKILIVNLSKGELGEDAAALLGCIIVTQIQLTALYRARLPEHERIPFYLYIDEMQSFVTLSFTDILAEARKYRLSLFLTHQYIEQLDEKVCKAIFGNVGTIISFRVGAKDAAYLKKEFEPTFTEEDLVNLPKYGIYLKLMIDGATSRPFSATTLPKQPATENHKATIIANCRKKYSTKKLEDNSLLSQYVDSSPRLFN